MDWKTRQRSLFKDRTLPLILVFMSTLSACTEHSEEKETKFKTAHPWIDRVELSQSYVAQIRAIQRIELRAFEKGYLQNIYVDEGQVIKKGQKMFQIMPVLMNAEYQKAQAEYKITEIEYKNTKTLADQHVVSKNALNLAKAKYDKAEAELNLAKAHLDLTTIKAPFDGIMDRFRVRLGSLVEEGELLSTLSDVSQLWVYFNVTESDYLAYVKNKERTGGSTVKLMLANGQMYEHSGTIDTIESEFNNETGNIAFRATFPNPDSLLRHGETGNVILTNTIEHALLIPQKATFEVLDKRFVYVVDKKGTLEAREIEVASEVPHLFVIRSGLSEKDTILIEGIGKVNKGDSVKTELLGKSEVLKSLELHAE